MTNSRKQSDSAEYPMARALSMNSRLISSGTSVFSGSVHLPQPPVVGRLRLTLFDDMAHTTIDLWAAAKLRGLLWKAESAAALVMRKA